MVYNIVTIRLVECEMRHTTLNIVPREKKNKVY